MSNLKEKILASEDIPREPIDLTEFGWPEGLFVRGLTALEHVKLTSDAVKKERSFVPRMAAMALVDENGSSVFEAKDWEQLGKKGMEPVERVAELCMQLSGLTEREENELKNESGEAAADASPTDSLFL